MNIGVPKEIKTDEYRVAMIPVGVEELTRGGHQVLIQAGLVGDVPEPGAVLGENQAAIAAAARPRPRPVSGSGAGEGDNRDEPPHSVHDSSIGKERRGRKGEKACART